MANTIKNILCFRKILPYFDKKKDFGEKMVNDIFTNNINKAMLRRKSTKDFKVPEKYIKNQFLSFSPQIFRYFNSSLLSTDNNIKKICKRNKHDSQKYPKNSKEKSRSSVGLYKKKKLKHTKIDYSKNKTEDPSKTKRSAGKENSLVKLMEERRDSTSADVKNTGRSLKKKGSNEKINFTQVKNWRKKEEDAFCKRLDNHESITVSFAKKNDISMENVDLLENKKFFFNKKGETVESNLSPLRKAIGSAKDSRFFSPNKNVDPSKSKNMSAFRSSILNRNVDSKSEIIKNKQNSSTPNVKKKFVPTKVLDNLKKEQSSNIIGEHFAKNKRQLQSVSELKEEGFLPTYRHSWRLENNSTQEYTSDIMKRKENSKTIPVNKKEYAFKMNVCPLKKEQSPVSKGKKVGISLSNPKNTKESKEYSNILSTGKSFVHLKKTLNTKKEINRTKENYNTMKQGDSFVKNKVLKKKQSLVEKLKDNGANIKKSIEFKEDSTCNNKKLDPSTSKYISALRSANLNSENAVSKIRKSFSSMKDLDQLKNERNGGSVNNFVAANKKLYPLSLKYTPAHVYFKKETNVKLAISKGNKDEPTKSEHSFKKTQSPNKLNENVGNCFNTPRNYNISHFNKKEEASTKVKDLLKKKQSFVSKMVENVGGSLDNPKKTMELKENPTFVPANKNQDSWKLKDATEPKSADVNEYLGLRKEILKKKEYHRISYFDEKFSQKMKASPLKDEQSTVKKMEETSNNLNPSKKQLTRKVNDAPVPKFTKEEIMTNMGNSSISSTKEKVVASAKKLDLLTSERSSVKKLKEIICKSLNTPKKRIELKKDTSFASVNLGKCPPKLEDTSVDQYTIEEIMKISNSRTLSNKNKDASTQYLNALKKELSPAKKTEENFGNILKPTNTKQNPSMSNNIEENVNSFSHRKFPMELKDLNFTSVHNKLYPWKLKYSPTHRNIRTEAKSDFSYVKKNNDACIKIEDLPKHDQSSLKKMEEIIGHCTRSKPTMDSKGDSAGRRFVTGNIKPDPWITHYISAFNKKKLNNNTELKKDTTKTKQSSSISYDNDKDSSMKYLLLDQVKKETYPAIKIDKNIVNLFNSRRKSTMELRNYLDFASAHKKIYPWKLKHLPVYRYSKKEKRKSKYNTPFFTSSKYEYRTKKNKNEIQ